MFIVTKKEPRCEYRIYIDNENKFEGTLIYRGHKLGIENNILPQFLDYRIEKKSGNIYTLKYDRVNGNPIHTDLSIWNIGGIDSFDKNISESWESCKKCLENKYGTFRKIIISKVNI